MRINASMLLGSLLAWVIAPYALQGAHVLGEKFERTDVLFWIMWPAIGMIVVIAIISTSGAPAAIAETVEVGSV